MNVELFYLFDSHCPWSYATTAIVNEAATAFPDMKVHLLHCARYDGDEGINDELLDAVKSDSDIKFSDAYVNNLSKAKDSTIAANLLSWTQYKAHKKALSLLNDLHQAHFLHGNELTSKDDFQAIIDRLKLSPPEKIFNIDKLSKDAESVLMEIEEFQEIIGTNAIPAILLAVDDNLVLLNHNLYLKSPKAIVDAIKLELN